MKRGLSWRLAFTHIAVALLAIAIVAVIIQFAGGQRFDSYVTDSAVRARERLVSSITAAYEQSSGWSVASAYTIDELARTAEVGVAIYDSQGQLVIVAGRPGRGGGRGHDMMGGEPGVIFDGGGGMMGQSGTDMPQGWMSSDWDHYTQPVSVDGTRVGTVVIHQQRVLGQSTNSAFRRDITLYLLLAGLGAAAVALLVSVGVSRRISRPIVQLTGAADEIAQGRRDVDVPAGGQDEVAHLARAFNEMTQALARQEEWRRTTTADLAHELRTPLATIQARVEALEDGVLPASPENLRIIGQEVERLGRMLGTLRAMDEIDADSFTLNTVGLDLGDLVRDVASVAGPAFTQAGLRLVVTAESCRVDGDGDRLTQVLGNLLDNARKFTPSGGTVALDLRRMGVEHGRALARLAVSDTGPGIPEEEREYVFERFYRGTGGRAKEGAGIGLAIVRRLVEAHGGTVKAVASESGGAAFVVEIPCSES
jgi:two-component system, OmpR family, sensor histidine kinase BaeS